jgi:hypothetical protein
MSGMILSKHLIRQARAKGFDLNQIRLTADQPTIRYASRNHPGQMRHIRGDYVVVVEGNTAITAYLNIVKTPIRKDQLA